MSRNAGEAPARTSAAGKLLALGLGLQQLVHVGEDTESERKSFLLCVFVCLSVCPSVCPSVRLSVGLSVRRSVCLSVCLSVGLSVCLFVCLSVWLSVSVRLCMWLYLSNANVFTRVHVCTCATCFA